MRRVVVQWARLGDLFQTRPLLRALAGAEVILCVDARYAELARSFPEVNAVWPVDLSRLSALARHAESHAGFIRAAAGLLDNVDTAGECEVYVLSRSVAAVAFAELLEPSAIHGYRRAGDVLSTPEVFRRLERHEPLSENEPQHLADIWSSLHGHDLAPEWLPPLRRTATHKPDLTCRIGIFCDAGEAHRRIPAAWLRDLAEILCRDADVNLELYGQQAAPDELTQATLLSGGTITDRRGQTTLEQLADCLTACDVIIGADTGGLHYAAALNVPVLGLYFGGAQALRTGPYAPRSFVMENPLWTRETAHEAATLAFHLAGRESATVRIVRTNSLQPALTAAGLRYVPAILEARQLPQSQAVDLPTMTVPCLL
jgi:ADP-heptose:LPS heptosyltransferase